MAERLHLEDFEVGQKFRSNEDYVITPERIHGYAAEFDPQPIHLDSEAAAEGLFGEIVASGWHTASATMRLVVRSQIFGGGPVVGLGIDHLRFLNPVRPGDRIRAEAEVVEVRRSSSKPDRGYVVLRITTTNQDGVEVMTQEWTLLVPRRAEG